MAKESELGRANVSIRATLQDLDKDLSKAKGMIGGALSSIQGVGTMALGVLGGGLAVLGGGLAAIGAVVKTTLPLAADFESQVATLGIAASNSGLSLVELHDAALAVGGDADLLGVSATGAADAMTGLYKAGLTTTEIFGDVQGYMAGTAELGGALRASIDLAAATQLDMVQASDLAAIALSTFGAELETEAERADFVNDTFNNLVQTADASVAEVEDLAAAWQAVGPTASALGVGVEDLNTALGILSTRGITGSEAGTALKAMLTNLQRPTPAVTEALAALNVELYDAEGNFIGLPALVEDLSGALTGASGIINEMGGITGTAVSSLAGLTDEQRNLAVQTIAGTYGMNALNTLVSEGASGWEAMTAATADAAGIQEQAAAKADTFNGMMEGLEGTLEAVKITIGESFLPAAAEMLTIFGELLEKVGPLITEGFGRLGPILTDVATSIGDFVTALLDGESPLDAFIGLLADFLPAETVQSVMDFIAGVQELVATVTPYVEQAVAWIAENVALRDVLLALAGAVLTVVVPAVWGLLSPILAVVAAFVGIMAVVVLLRKVWEEDLGGIRTFLETAWAKIQPVLLALWEWLSTNIPAAIGVLVEWWQTQLMPALRTVWDFIAEYMLPVCVAMGELIGAVIVTGSRILVAVWRRYLLPIIKKVWEWLEKLWTGLEETLRPVLEWLAEFIKTSVTPAWKELLNVVKMIVEWIKKATQRIKKLGESLPDWLTPGSPTPLELGLRGIANELRQVDKLMGGLNTQMTVSAVAGAGGTPHQWLGDVVIYGSGDPQATANAVLRVLQDRGMIPLAALR